MSRELRIHVGVIAEKRKSSSQWAEDYWIPTGVVESHLNQHEGDVLYQTDDLKRYFMGYSEIYCHAKETEAYIHNFESRVPAIYVILRRDDENAHSLDWYVHDVTVSPYEAQDYSDSAEDIVERVAMPVGIAKRVMEFIDLHHVDEKFKKRKRKDFKSEIKQFGKEPIFLERDRPDKNGGFDA
ncbi:MAG: DUF3305 domain-containing protein [Salaquimonas sp.]